MAQSLSEDRVKPEDIKTPEGDNEDLPDAPLQPGLDGLQQVPSIDTNKL